MVCRICPARLTAVLKFPHIFGAFNCRSRYLSDLVDSRNRTVQAKPYYLKLRII